MTKAKNKVILTQKRSSSGRSERFVATLTALGLGRIGRTREHIVTPAIVGMIERVQTVLDIRIVK